MDWRHPDYGAVLKFRLRMLEEVRRDAGAMADLKAYYRAGNYADFISDWGVTFDPRNAEIGLPTVIPFVLFPRQREWVDWVVAKWRAQRPGATEKSRDMGISWLATSLACTLCLHVDGVAIGFGSRVVDLVDKIGRMKPLLPKARFFMEHLPVEFRGGWLSWRDAPYMLLNFPETGSMIMGEGGDQIGRGDRAAIYFVDEAEYLERPELIENALSQTTNCRIDMSSVSGSSNPIAQKILKGRVDTFVFDWRQDPRKDDAWYAKMCEDHDPVTVAQEIDRDRAASVTGVVIPGAWVRASIDALDKLGIAPTGARMLSLDVADEGVDNNAVVGMQGVEVEFLEDWSGKGGDIFQTTTRAFEICDELNYPGFRYDADGMGASVRGDARVINDQRKARGQRALAIEPFRGSDGVFDPEGVVDGTIGSNGDKGRRNKDYFANRKAQGWWALRRRFQLTHRWITKGVPCNGDEIISINSKAENYLQLVTECSQPTYMFNGIGKMLINKKPDGLKSPNYGDALMQRLAPNARPPLVITPDLLARIGRSRRR